MYCDANMTQKLYNKTMKKLLTHLLFTISLLKADSFFSVGLGENEIDYTDKRVNAPIYFVTKSTTSLLLEYGDDDSENYRKYLASEMSSDYQSISAMAEWAPRFNFFPTWLKSIVGLPSFSFGIGLGYNNFKVENKDIRFLSYSLNYNLMFEVDKYCLKIGYKSIDDIQNKDEDFDDIGSDITYIVLEYIF